MTGMMAGAFMAARSAAPPLAGSRGGCEIAASGRPLPPTPPLMPSTPSSSPPPAGQPGPDAARIEAAFDRARAELEIRLGFPGEVMREAEAAAEREPASEPGRTDLSAVPFVTIDPPGSRDLDQALHFERTEGGGMRLRYAIADVGAFVDRGGVVEAEAWLRGLTFYAPDEKEPLYPAVLSQDAASLLAGQDRPSIVFTLELDARAEPTAVRVERARVRSRAQLTYAEALEHVEGGGARFRDEEWSESLLLLRPFGEERRRRETERGGVSIPLLAQHVQRDAAARLGYVLEYERPNPAEDWNAQVSLLTGHVAARRMLDAGVGLLRVMPPGHPNALAAFRQAALALGFEWPEAMPYAEFIHSVDRAHPLATTLFWQARRTGGGSDYAAFDGAPPEHPRHAALAMEYAHVTAPLRRLADRYVLELLVELEAGRRPRPEEVETLRKLPALMDEAEKKAGRMERRMVDIAEAWTLRGHEGETFPAVVLAVRDDWTDVQMGEHPVRASIRGNGGARPEPGASVRVRLGSVDVETGQLGLDLVP